MDAIKLIRQQLEHDKTVAEVTEARHDGNVQYNSLKARLDAMTNDLSTVDNKITAAIDGLQWKESVDSFADLATTYTNPKEGWTASTNDTNEVYRYDETDGEWKKLIDLSTIPKATPTSDGLMSKEDKTKLDGIDSSKLVTTDGAQTITGSLTITGGVVGNASTATALETARDIILQGDVTGNATFNGTANAVINSTLSEVKRTNTTVSETLDFGDSFTAISKVTSDTKGRLTEVETKTVTLPNITAVTDENVKNTPNATTKAYITATTNNTESTGTQVFDTGVYLDVTAGHLTATQFNGKLNGNANTATKLQNARTINGVSFDGSKNIEVTGANVKVTGYTKGQTYTPIVATDTVNVALGKLEIGLNGKLDKTASVNLTSTIAEHTVTQATTKEVIIGAEVLPTDILVVYLSGVRLHPTKHYTLTHGNATTAKITAGIGIDFLKDDHFTFEILRASLA